MKAMTCRQLTERARSYSCGCPECAERCAIEAHLMVCDRCLRYVGELERTARLVRAAFGLSP